MPLMSLKEGGFVVRRGGKSMKGRPKTNSEFLTFTVRDVERDGHDKKWMFMWGSLSSRMAEGTWG